MDIVIIIIYLIYLLHLLMLKSSSYLFIKCILQVETAYCTGCKSRESSAVARWAIADLFSRCFVFCFADLGYCFGLLIFVFVVILVLVMF